MTQTLCISVVNESLVSYDLQAADRKNGHQRNLVFLANLQTLQHGHRQQYNHEIRQNVQN